MKKYTLLFSAMLLGISLFAQQKPSKKNELTIGLSLPEHMNDGDTVNIHKDGKFIKSVLLSSEMIAKKFIYINPEEYNLGEYMFSFIQKGIVVDEHFFVNNASNQILNDLDNSHNRRKSISFNPKTRICSIETSIDVSIGEELKIVDNKENLITSIAVTDEMIKQKKYSIYLPGAGSGDFKVNLSNKVSGRFSFE